MVLIVDDSGEGSAGVIDHIQEEKECGKELLQREGKKKED